MIEITEAGQNAIIALADRAFWGIVAVSISFTIVAGIAFWKQGKGSATTFTRLFERANAFQMLTVLLIVGAVIFLALAGIISGEATAGILGSIASFVLGGIVGSRSIQQPSSKTFNNNQLEAPLLPFDQN